MARRALWDVGLDYGHGTGHGVGAYLNVHEYPPLLTSSASSSYNPTGILENMFTSNGTFTCLKTLCFHLPIAF